MSDGETIFALSSGAGRAGIAVVRVSGPGAGHALSQMAGGCPVPRRATVRAICDPVSAALLDTGVVLYFNGPASVTGEDVAEFHVHGGLAVVAGVLAALQKLEGFRPAEAGEFSLRAFRNGRMDLVQAEGLGDLLAAETEQQRQQAVFQASGGASSVYQTWRNQLVAILARIEATVDFTDEEDVVAASVGDMGPAVFALVQEMTAALAKAGQGEMLREGVRVVLAGLPNTGKSSLLNALAQRDVAIVSDVAGTTRDVIEVHLDLGGLPVLVSDTAGLRTETRDRIEAIGMDRARSAARGAGVVVWVAAPDVPGSETIPFGMTADIRVWNKYDLESSPQGYVACSTASPDGVALVLAALTALVRERCSPTGRAVVVRARQAAAIKESIRHLNESIRHHTDQLELMAEDLRRAADALGRLTGAVGVEDILGAIFSEFCVGK